MAFPGCGTGSSTPTDASRPQPAGYVSVLPTRGLEVVARWKSIVTRGSEGVSRELLIDRGGCSECRDSACRSGGSVVIFHHKGLRGGNGSSWPPHPSYLLEANKLPVMWVCLSATEGYTTLYIQMRKRSPGRWARHLFDFGNLVGPFDSGILPRPWRFGEQIVFIEHLASFFR